jgi:AcrR family transcriptional regulator
VPKLWSRTIETHRREVHHAILDTTAALVAEGGLRAATMSEIAERTGIGRATLYKYFPSIEAILLAWHERQIAGHLDELIRVRDGAGSPEEALNAVLTAFAHSSRDSHGHHDAELAAFLHANEHVAGAQQRLVGMIRDLVAEGQERGELRDDVAPEELAAYSLHALSAARALPKAAVRRLVVVTVDGLRTRA